MIGRLLAAAVVFGGFAGYAASNADTLRELVALERAQMDGWVKGDPQPSIKLLDPEATFFHAIAASARLDGAAAVKGLYGAYEGMPLFESYEILQPKVQQHGDIAILTYYLAQRRNGTTAYWNGTQVYQRQKDGWKILHTHWSEAKQAPPSTAAQPR